MEINRCHFIPYHKEAHSLHTIHFVLETISQQLSYNRKYISAVFKKHMGVGVSEYVNTVRIQNACTFLRQGYTCVGDIAWRCGFSDAQYFSRVFQEKMGVTPTQFMRQL